jgi:hypothetical protein
MYGSTFVLRYESTFVRKYNYFRKYFRTFENINFIFKRRWQLTKVQCILRVLYNVQLYFRTFVLSKIIRKYFRTFESILSCLSIFVRKYFRTFVLLYNYCTRTVQYHVIPNIFISLLGYRGSTFESTFVLSYFCTKVLSYIQYVYKVHYGYCSLCHPNQSIFRGEYTYT